MDGPAGTGKTRAILEYANAVLSKHAMARALITRKTRASLTDSVLVTLESKVLGLSHPAVMNGPTRPFRLHYDYPNGSQIVVGGLDQPTRTYSAEYDLVLAFEAIETQQEEVEQLLRTLRNGQRFVHGASCHQLICDTNPGWATHWLNQQANEGWFKRILSRHEDNPYLWDGEAWTPEGAQYIAMLDALTGARRERLRWGRWVNSEGVVYNEFDARTHVLDTLPDIRGWKRIRAIDFGYNDPFVCQWYAIQDDVAILYREIYMSGRLVEDHAKDIVRLSAGETYQATLSDHDREDRETLHRHGVGTVAANKDIDTGIQALKNRLKVAGNGKPRVLFYRNALVERDKTLAAARRPTSTIEEFDCYIWAKRSDGNTKDVPLDRDNHGMDAARYGVAYLDLKRSGSYVGFIS